MIGTRFKLPFEPDRLSHTELRTENREVQRLEPVYDDNGQVLEYKTIATVVTDEIPFQEWYDNPAPNTMAKFSAACLWCTQNGARPVLHTEQTNEFPQGWIEIEALPVPTAEDVRRAEMTARIDELQEYLRSTDWYAIRFADSGVEIPAGVKQARQEARDEIDTLRAELEALAEQPAG